MEKRIVIPEYDMFPRFKLTANCTLEILVDLNENLHIVLRQNNEKENISSTDKYVLDGLYVKEQLIISGERKIVPPITFENLLCNTLRLEISIDTEKNALLFYVFVFDKNRKGKIPHRGIAVDLLFVKKKHNTIEKDIHGEDYSKEGCL